MSSFYINFSGFATTTSAKTAAKIIGASGKLLDCYEIGMYGDGLTAPADVQHSCQAGFLSNAGAGTPGASPTPEKKNQASAASGLTAGTSYSAEPTTYTVTPAQLFAFNQRGGMRFAVPPGQGFKTDGAQTNLSFGVRVQSSAAGAVQGYVEWGE